MIMWDEDGRTIQEARHDRYDDDIGDELFDYWNWAEEREMWFEAIKKGDPEGSPF